MVNVDEEIALLQKELVRLGTRDSKDNKIKVKYGVLFKDERCTNLFEAILGTLKAAKKRKIVTFEGELLLQGVHDNVDVILLVEPTDV